MGPNVRVEVFDFPGRIAESHAVRRRVFVEEQAVRDDEEIDGLDPECLHFLALLDGRPVGAARLRHAGDGVAKAERVAVLAELRGRGVGAALMHALEAAACERGFVCVLLGAQLTAVGFYERLGYAVEGEEFLDARIHHRWMRRSLDGRTRAARRS
jgi:predicted GNAT family N-acyltransferase